MNFPLGQVSEDVDDLYFFDAPMVSDSGIATTSAVEEPTFLPNPVFYLFRTYSDKKSTWEQLTGLKFATNTPEVIADAFRRVVQKHVERGGSQRDAFGDWLGYKIDPPTPPEQAIANGQVDKALVETGAIIEGSNPDNPQEQMMHVDYYVTLDPGIVRAGIPSTPEEPGEVGTFTDRTKLAGAAGLVIGGLATSLLVKKGIGLKLLAGFAGGVVAAGVFMAAARATEEPRA